MLVIDEHVTEETFDMIRPNKNFVVKIELPAYKYTELHLLEVAVVYKNIFGNQYKKDFQFIVRKEFGTETNKDLSLTLISSCNAIRVDETHDLDEKVHVIK